MANTTNYGLLKPDRTDSINDVDKSLSDNFVTIDLEIKNRENEIEGHIAGTNGQHTSEVITHSDGSVKSALDNHETRLGNLETETTDHETRLTDIETLGIDKLAPDLEGRLSTVESDVEGILAPATLEAMSQQSYTFDEYRIGYVENALVPINEQLADKASQLSDISLNLNTFKRQSGETDDSALIQRAIEQARTSNQVILVPNKTFTFSQTLNLYNGISFQGQNKYSTLQYTGTGIAFNMIDTVNNTQDPTYGYGCYYNAFSSLNILGNGTSSGTAFKGELRYSNFHNVTIRNFQTFFDFNNNWTNKFTNCLFQNADTWFKAGSQNNAVTFVNCAFGQSRIGFQMKSCYSLNFIGGNIELCTSAVFQPTQAGGIAWSNVNIDGVYLENTAPLITTDVTAADGSTITSWEIRGFNLANSNINFFVPVGSFIKTSISNVVMGEIRNCVFYKNDNSTLFDMASSPVVFNNNQYRYFSGGSKLDLTTPFSASMQTGNTSYQRIDTQYPNSMVYSGAINVGKGIVLGDTSDTNLLNKEGHLYYVTQRKILRVSTGTGTYNYIQPVQSGTTALRPTYSSLQAGIQYYDTSLGKPIWWNGTAWKDVNGTTV